jgi:hypothetical protein
VNGSSEYVIGSDVACCDGTCGQLRRGIVDPVARTLTHLVVEPRHRLSLTKDEVRDLPPLERTTPGT